MTTDPNILDDDTQNKAADATVMANSLEAVVASETKEARLIVIAGGEIGQEFVIRGQRNVIGRGATADVVIAEQSVSRNHAQLDLQEEEGETTFILTDLNSSNGVLVNGDKIDRCPLKDGDKVQLGDVLFKFIMQDAVEAQYHQQVHRLIHFDQLTGLMTMGAFITRLGDTIRNASKDTVFCLAMTDLDGLKRVNDTYGHLAGRMVVGEMGKMIRGSVRLKDIPALYGGDEAIILFPNTTLEEAAVVAEKLRATVREEEFKFHGQTFQVSISQGLAQWPDQGRTAEEIIAAADEALYTAKQEGRDRVCLSTTGRVTE